MTSKSRAPDSEKDHAQADISSDFAVLKRRRML
jgi:hypothetical protein